MVRITEEKTSIRGGEKVEVDRCRLESWKEIALYLNRDVRTAQRWERQEGLPIHRHIHEKSGSVHAFPREVEAWRDRRSQRKWFEAEQKVFSSVPSALGKKEYAVIRSLLEAILARLPDDSVEAARVLADEAKGNVDMRDGIVSPNPGARMDKIDGNGIQSQAFLPRMQ